MPEERFDIYFAGQLIDGQDPAEARAKVGQLFKAGEEQLRKLFCGKPVAVKKNVDLETASRYRLAFRKAGALVEIRPCAGAAANPPGGETQQPAAQPQPAPAAPGMTLLPANTGSLEDCAPPVKPEPIPDISGIGMAAPGVRMDDTPPPQPARIDTGDIDLVPGQDWSLEDCQPPPLPSVMPDLEGLDLAAPDDQSHIPPEPPPRPLPDISALTLEKPAEEAKPRNPFLDE